MSVGVTTVKMDARIVWHEIQSFVQDRESLLISSLFKQACAHVVISQPDLNGHVVLKVFSVHELRRSFEVRKRLVEILGLSVKTSAE